MMFQCSVAQNGGKTTSVSGTPLQGLMTFHYIAFFFFFFPLSKILQSMSASRNSESQDVYTCTITMMALSKDPARAQSK